MNKFKIEHPKEIDKKLKEALINKVPERVTENLKKSEIKY